MTRRLPEKREHLSLKHPVFVVGVGTDVLSLVRDFGSRGVECWACCSKRVPGTGSRFARYYYIADPTKDEDAMIDGLIELARKQVHPPVIVTGCDQHAQALARHRERLSEVALPCIAHSDAVETLIHKVRFSAWAEQHLTSHPRSVPATQFQAGDDIPFPVIAKPNHRGFSNSTKLELPTEDELHERRFTLITNEAQWNDFRAQQQRFLPYLLIQQYISGTSASKYSVCIYADHNSDIRAQFIGRRIRGYPALYGDATLVQSDSVPESVLAEVATMVKKLGYHGIAEAEYNKDAKTGEFHLLEMNPRCWGWIGITAVTCCDIPWIAYRDLTGQEIETFVQGPATGEVKMLYLIQDAANVFLRYRWHYPPWVQSVSSWRLSFQADKLVIWEFDRRDWRGTFSCFSFFVIKALRNIGRKFNPFRTA